MTKSSLDSLSERFPQEGLLIKDFVERDIGALFRKSAFLSKVPDYLLAFLELFSEYKRFSDDKIIFEKGTMSSMMYFPLSGRKFIHPGTLSLLFDGMNKPIDEDIIGLSSFLFDIVNVDSLAVPYNSQFICIYTSDMKFLREHFKIFDKLCTDVITRTKSYFLGMASFTGAISDSDNLNLLTSVCKFQGFPSQTVISAQSAVMDTFFIMARGEVQITSNKVNICSRKLGETFGLLGLMEKPKRIYMEFISKTPCIMLTLNSEDVASLIRAHPFMEQILSPPFSHFADLTTRCRTALPFLSDATYLYHQLFQLVLSPVFLNKGYNEVLFREGDDDEDGYIVIRGTLQASRNGVMLATFMAGTLFGMLPFEIVLPRHITVSLQSESNSAVLAKIDKRLLKSIFSFLPRTLTDSFASILPIWGARFIQLLRLPFFKGLHHAELTNIVTLASTIKYAKGDVVSKQGDIPSKFLYIVTGIITITYKLENTIKEKEIYIGGHLHETALIGASIRSLYSATAKTDVVCIAFDSIDIKKLLGSDPLLNLTFKLRILREQARCSEFLRHPLAIKYLKRFLQSSYTDENLMFLGDVYKYKYERKPELKKELYDHVIKKYFSSSDGTCPINIEDKVIKFIMSSSSTFDYINDTSIFDEAIDGVIVMMEEPFARFKLDSLFQSFYGVTHSFTINALYTDRSSIRIMENPFHSNFLLTTLVMVIDYYLYLTLIDNLDEEESKSFAFPKLIKSYPSSSKMENLHIQDRDSV